jgi:hypothetical protein
MSTVTNKWDWEIKATTSDWNWKMHELLTYRHLLLSLVQRTFC